MRPLKDGLNGPAVERLAGNLGRSGAAVGGFVEAALEGLEELEMKARVEHIADALEGVLPADFGDATPILLRIPEFWDAGEPGDSLGGFAAWPLFRYVARHGPTRFESGLEVLRALTHLFTAEFAVRAFFADGLERALPTLRRWATDPDEHVRRLVSDGTRPLLPWASRVPALDGAPAAVVELLEALVDDPSPYVRRSVANHVNDISKSQPELALRLCSRWLSAPSPQRTAVGRRALRTLVKAGDPRVWVVLGFTASPQVEVELTVDSPVRWGSSTELRATLRSTSPSEQRLVVDFAVRFVKADGSRRPHVFKGRNIELPPGGTATVRRTLSFAPTTTRRLYPGQQAVVLQVCGQELARADLELIAPTS